jgi:hypothetical protein
MSYSLFVGDDRLPDFEDMDTADESDQTARIDKVQKDVMHKSSVRVQAVHHTNGT